MKKSSSAQEAEIRSFSHPKIVWLRQISALVIAMGLATLHVGAAIMTSGDVTVQTLDFIPLDPQPAIGPGNTDLGLDVQIGVGSGAGELQVNNGHVLRAGRLVSYSTIIGAADVSIAGLGSRIELASQSSSSPGPLDFASQGTATLSITGGGALELTTAQGVCDDFQCGAVIVGNAAGSTSLFTITGSGSLLDLDIGTAQITNFGQDAVFTVAQDGFDFGTPGANSEVIVDVLNGGQLRTRYAGLAVVGGASSGNGNERVDTIITVDGVGSVWDDSSLIFLGYNFGEPDTPQSNAVSDGRIIVSNGGAVNTPQIQVGPGGRINVLQGGQMSASNAFSQGGAIDVSGLGASLAVGDAALNGIANISGVGAEFAIGGGPAVGSRLFLGRNNDTGQAFVENGATLTVDGFDDPNNFSEALVYIGFGGNGDLTVRSGGQMLVRDLSLSSGPDGILVGLSEPPTFNDYPGSGALTVTDEGSYLEINGDEAYLNVATSNAPFTGTAAAAGTLTIQNGADVLVDGNDRVGFIGAGRGGNTVGSILVNGTGTNVRITGATGHLSIGNNFTEAVGSGLATLLVSDNALIEIDGTGENGGRLTVGVGMSMGTAVIESGAHVDVKQSTSAPSSGGDVFIGEQDSAGGFLVINDTGLVSARNTIIDNNGQLSGTGAIQSDVVVSGGSIAPGASIGTLTIGDSLQVDAGQLLIEIGGAMTGEYDTLVVNGPVDLLGGEVKFLFINGFIPELGDTFDVLLSSQPVIDAAVQFTAEGLANNLGFAVNATGSGLQLAIVELDSDGDGIPDTADNCTLAINADQRDTNGDGIGNACDADFNNDCLINFQDISIIAGLFLQTGDLDADINGDMAVNFIDFAFVTSQFLGVPGPSGIANSCES